MEEIAAVAVEYSRKLEPESEHPSEQLFNQLEALDSQFHRRVLVDNLNRLVERHALSTDWAKERLLELDGAVSGAKATEIANSFFETPEYGLLVSETRRLLEKGSAAMSIASPSTGHNDERSTRDSLGGGADVLRFDVDGEDEDEILRLDDQSWSNEGTDKRMMLYSLVVELLDESERQHMMQHGGPDEMMWGNDDAVGVAEFGASSADSHEEAAVPSAAAHSVASRQESEMAATAASRTSEQYHAIDGEEFLGRLEQIAASDVMEFEKWEKVIVKLAVQLARVHDDAPLVQITRLFGAAAGEQAAKLYLLLADHVGTLESSDASLGAKVTVLWRMQMELPGHWVCFDGSMFKPLWEKTIQTIVHRHLYAVGVVDPNASWLEFWLRTPPMRSLFRESLADVGTGFLTVLQSAAASNTHALSILCLSNVDTPQPAISSWIVEHLDALLPLTTSHETVMAVAGHFARGAAGISGVQLSAALKGLTKRVAGADGKQTPAVYVSLLVLSGWLRDVPAVKLEQTAWEEAMMNSSTFTAIMRCATTIKCAATSVLSAIAGFPCDHFLQPFVDWLLERAIDVSQRPSTASRAEGDAIMLHDLESSGVDMPETQQRSLYRELLADTVGESPAALLSFSVQAPTPLLDAVCGVLLDRALHGIAPDAATHAPALRQLSHASCSLRMWKRLRSLVWSSVGIEDTNQLSTVIGTVAAIGNAGDHVTQPDVTKAELSLRFSLLLHVELLGVAIYPDEVTAPLRGAVARCCSAGTTDDRPTIISDEERHLTLSIAVVAAAHPSFMANALCSGETVSAVTAALSDHVILPPVHVTPPLSPNLRSPAHRGPTDAEDVTLQLRPGTAPLEMSPADATLHLDDTDVRSRSPACEVDPVTVLLHALQLHGSGFGAVPEHPIDFSIAASSINFGFEAPLEVALQWRSDLHVRASPAVKLAASPTPSDGLEEQLTFMREHLAPAAATVLTSREGYSAPVAKAGATPAMPAAAAVIWPQVLRYGRERELFPSTVADPQLEAAFSTACSFSACGNVWWTSLLFLALEGRWEAVVAVEDATNYHHCPPQQGRADGLELPPPRTRSGPIHFDELNIFRCGEEGLEIAASVASEMMEHLPEHVASQVRRSAIHPTMLVHRWCSFAFVGAGGFADVLRLVRAVAEGGAASLGKVAAALLRLPEVPCKQLHREVPAEHATVNALMGWFSSAV